jgi:hypothetical protein
MLAKEGWYLVLVPDEKMEMYFRNTAKIPRHDSPGGRRNKKQSISVIASCHKFEFSLQAHKSQHSNNMPSKKEKAEALRGDKQKVRLGTHTWHILCDNHPRTNSYLCVDSLLSRTQQEARVKRRVEPKRQIQRPRKAERRKSKRNSFRTSEED